MGNPSLRLSEVLCDSIFDDIPPQMKILNTFIPLLCEICWWLKKTYGQGFFQQFWEKAYGQNWEKMIDLTAKLGEINNIEHNRGSKILKIKLF